MVCTLINKNNLSLFLMSLQQILTTVMTNIVVDMNTDHVKSLSICFLPLTISTSIKTILLVYNHCVTSWHEQRCLHSV